jgi:hypothetical protein
MAFHIKTPIGAIKDLLLLPCTPTPMIWATSAAEAAVRLFIAYNEPDMKHVIHQLSGRTLLCSAKVIAKSFVEEVNIENTFLDHYIWYIPEAAELFAWYFFLASITLEGLINWETALMKMTKASCNPNATYNSGNVCHIGQHADGQWQTGGGWTNSSDPISPLYGGTIRVGNGWTGTIAASCAFYDLAGDMLPGGLRYIDTRSGEVLDEMSMNTKTTSKLGNYKVKASDGNVFGAPGFIQLQVMISGGGQPAIGFGGAGYQSQLYTNP